MSLAIFMRLTAIVRTMPLAYSSGSIRALRDEVIPGFPQCDAGHLLDVCERATRELRVCASPGPDPRTAEGNMQKVLLRVFEALQTALHLPRVSTKLLPEPNWRSVLQMRSARLDAPEFGGFSCSPLARRSNAGVDCSLIIINAAR